MARMAAPAVLALVAAVQGPGRDRRTESRQQCRRDAVLCAAARQYCFTAPWLRRYLPEPVTGGRLALFALTGVLDGPGSDALAVRRASSRQRCHPGDPVRLLRGRLVASGCRAVGVARRWLLRVATLVLALVAVKSVAVAGQFGDRIDYLAGDWHSVERARGAWADVQARLTAQPPLKYWEAADAPVQIRLAQYAPNVCRARDACSSFGPPEIYYYADQLMASRHLFFDAGYERLPVEERLALEKIQRFSPPLVFATGSLEAFTRQMYPGVVDYVGRTYEAVDSIEEEGVRYIILLKRNEPVVRPYGERHWPCMA